MVKAMNGSVNLREMLSTDLRSVAAAERRIFEKDFWKQKDFSELINRPSGMGMVAEVNGRIVGYLVGMQAADEAELLNIGVVPEGRRRGVARGLLRVWLGRLQERGSATVYLDVRPSNHPAITLYEKFGFAVVGCRRHYYSDGEDALIMKLTMPDQDHPFGTDEVY